MCGIAGAVGSNDPNLIEKMISIIKHRGPDGEETFRRGTAALGVCRLSIVGGPTDSVLIRGKNGAVLAFNGEIYNHKSLRRQLIASGCQFDTQTDSEVVLRLYEQYGVGCLDYLRGMFAFAILDNDRIFLARDRLGIKPLYYLHDPTSRLLLFASEIKSILQCEAYSPELDLQSLADFAILQHLVGARTFFRHILALPSGCYAIISANRAEMLTPPTSYHNRILPRLEERNFNDAVQHLGIVLTDALERHLDADVEVGLSLSGGIDSTILALFAGRILETPLQVFSIADSADHPDLTQAAYVADQINAVHHTHILSFDAFLNLVPHVVAAEEAPSNLWSIPLVALARSVSQHVKACIHGEGADELFGGYSEYLSRHAWLQQLRARLPLLREIGMSLSREAITTITRQSTEQDEDTYLVDLFALNLGDQLEHRHLLPVDRCGMAASVEFRVPFLDDEVFNFAARLPISYCVRTDIGVQKYILRHLAIREFGEPVLDIVLRRKLRGPSASSNLHARFDKLCDEVLPADYLKNNKFGRFFVRKRELLVFEMFVQHFIENRANPTGLQSALDCLEKRADTRHARRTISEYRSKQRRTTEGSALPMTFAVR
jgi:asparagine synthase (glutamine-hydrolysing)